MSHADTDVFVKLPRESHIYLNSYDTLSPPFNVQNSESSD